MFDVYLLLGSNLGDRELFLRMALRLIENDIAPVAKASAVYETQSWGKTDRPDYLNQVLMIKTELSAQEVLNKILAIELEMGRRREEKWGSRTIDIDILLYGDAVINEADLVVPHPEMHNRRFTLEPLSEIAPQLVHPVLHETIKALKNKLNDALIVKKLYI
jgi:2-amino-4-hydroxy-6-hydroxymethyldihydropteridine diphosphokinase